MPDNAEQLAVLGQNVLDAVIATYNPTHDPSLALALHPGQALADDIVQNGATNPLRLSEWIEDQYDYPLLLKRSDASSISASSVGSLTAKSAYLAMIPWAQPSDAPDAPAYARISAMIADARKDIGDNPDALPFSCEPTDFAEADTTVWHVFDQTIATSTTTTTTTDAPVRVNPQLWKMRVVTEALVDRLPSVTEVAGRRKMLSREVLGAPRKDALMKVRRMRSAIDTSLVATESISATPAPIMAYVLAAPPPVATVQPEVAHMNIFKRAGESRFMAYRPLTQVMAVDATPVFVAPAPAEPHLDLQLNAALIDRLGTMQIHDFVVAPVVEQVTTTGSDLHVHFEYCMLTITRKLAGTPWWHTDLIAEDDWCVPGMMRGDLVPESPDADHAHCLPQALLAVRNVAFTGSWTAAAKDSLTNQVSFLGPFLMRPETHTEATASSEQISVLGAGIQIIGELCSLLPPLPPRDAPTA